MSNVLATVAPTATRRTITSATSYEAAARAVDRLSDQGFPGRAVRIVGTGLCYVEQVSGRLTTGRAASTDAGSFFGVLAFSLVVGLVFGGLVGAVSHFMTQGRRDFDFGRHDARGPLRGPGRRRLRRRSRAAGRPDALALAHTTLTEKETHHVRHSR
jgi:hypothetical protein